MTLGNIAPLPLVRRTMRSGSAATWLLLCVGAWPVAGIAGYVLAGAIASSAPFENSEPSSFGQHRLTMTLWVAAWAPIAGAIIIGLAGGVRRWRLTAWVLAGSAAGAAVEFTLLAWGEARYGDQGADPDLLGATRFLSWFVVASTVTVVARSVAPSRGASALA